jgi:hypothetical protein
MPDRRHRCFLLAHEPSPLWQSSFHTVKGEPVGAAWLMLAVGDNREHAGNDGYDDLPSEHYSWDSTVANSTRPKVGDVIVLRDKDALLGVSVIDAIDVGEGTKQRRLCPVCSRSSIKQRRDLTPAFICDRRECRAVFDEPVEKTIDISTYRSRHDVAWVDMKGELSAGQLSPLCVMPKSQNSIRELDLDRFRLAVVARGVSPMTPVEAALRAIVGGHREAVVRVRIGQPAFRRQLLEEFSDVCAFTGPSPRDVLEGAHLYSYAASGKHHDSGGLLMRRDIHRLFDLGHIAVNPDTLLVDVAVSIRKFLAYAVLHGAPVQVRIDEKRRAWLREHWNSYRQPFPPLGSSAT